MVGFPQGANCALIEAHHTEASQVLQDDEGFGGPNARRGASGAPRWKLRMFQKAAHSHEIKGHEYIEQEAEEPVTDT